MSFLSSSRILRLPLVLALAGSLLSFLALNLTQQSANSQSALLPLILNQVQPRLITGELDLIPTTITQLVRGSAAERVTIYEADGDILASVRNGELQIPPSTQAQDFSAAIVIDDTLLANLTVREYVPVATSISAYFLPSLLVGLAIGLLGWQLQSITSRPGRGASRTENAEDNSPEVAPDGIPAFAFDPSNYGNPCLVMLIRLADLQETLSTRNELADYMETLWNLLERMGPAYGISCVGVHSGTLVLAASASNPAVALRHCIMFGWNIGSLTADRHGRPATWIAAAESPTDNPSHSFLSGCFDDADRALIRCQRLSNGHFEVCESLSLHLPGTVDTEPGEHSSRRVLSLDPKMLALWKRQMQSNRDES